VLDDGNAGNGARLVLIHGFGEAAEVLEADAGDTRGRVAGAAP
jgi:hypothetical protein